MFKTDKKSLEELSFSFNERDFANLKAIIENLKAKKLLTLSEEETQRTLDGLNTIGNLKLNGKIYAFHVEDSYASRQSREVGEGVELFLRQGDVLKEFYVPGSRDFCYRVEDATRFLRENNKPTIYTGEIPINSSFLGIHRECDEEDPLIRNILRDYEIEEFTNDRIEVIKLDSLI
jgi:hypothetical protein